MLQKKISGIEDLVFDRSFREWVYRPDNDINNYWNNFLQSDPANATLVNQAKAIIYALQVNEALLTEAEINQEISKILLRLNTASATAIDQLEDKPSVPLFFRGPAWMKAAAILILVAGSLYFFQRNNSGDPINSYEQFATDQKQKVIEQVNQLKDKTLVVLLPDGSRVDLEPKSRISYASNFEGDKREVYLVGEAFFTVSKDPAHPFFVYGNDIVTKVLGTSFRVKTQSENNNSVVMVRTGKVSVYKKKNFTNADAKPAELGGTVLLPNQQVTYNAALGSLTKSLVQEPAILIDASRHDFVFNATPIKQVFEKMESVYGIRIITDDEVIAGCTFSAILGKESFYQKLELICKSLNATYEVVDGDIVISSVGCK